MVIAIDGPGGVGKTTVSLAVSLRLGLVELNTGAHYRAATLAVLRCGADVNDAAAVIDVVGGAEIDYRDGRVFLDGVDVSDEIRSPAVTAAVSPVSAIAGVRTLLVAQQQAWVARRGGSAVVDGRDIGTVVFPDAEVKVFLTARPEVRAARRSGDREADGRDVASVAAELAERDRYDSSRDVSPLRPADDAVTIDTSDLTVDEVVDQIVALARAADRRARANRPI